MGLQVSVETNLVIHFNKSIFDTRVTFIHTVLTVDEGTRNSMKSIGLSTGCYFQFCFDCVATRQQKVRWARLLVLFCLNFERITDSRPKVLPT